MNHTPIESDLEDLYPADWLGRVEVMERDSVRVMVDTIYRDLAPRSVLDLGAGPCGHANAFADRGCMVTAVDGTLPAAKFASPAVHFQLADLRLPLDLGKTFQLVLCLEVMEHIPQEAEDVLCETLIRHTGNWLVITAAVPGQVGRHHINLKPLSYWRAKISNLGLEFDARRTHEWQQSWASADVMDYFVDNLLIFNRPRDE